jgi:hypothetical protein
VKVWNYVGHRYRRQCSWHSKIGVVARDVFIVLAHRHVLSVTGATKEVYLSYDVLRNFNCSYNDKNVPKRLFRVQRFCICV